MCQYLLTYMVFSKGSVFEDQGVDFDTVISKKYTPLHHHIHTHTGN